MHDPEILRELLEGVEALEGSSKELNAALHWRFDLLQNQKLYRELPGGIAQRNDGWIAEKDEWVEFTVPELFDYTGSVDVSLQLVDGHNLVLHRIDQHWFAEIKVETGYCRYLIVKSGNEHSKGLSAPISVVSAYLRLLLAQELETAQGARG